jgi:hypothetical protein
VCTRVGIEEEVPEQEAPSVIVPWAEAPDA